MVKVVRYKKKLTKKELKALNNAFQKQDPITLAQLPNNALEALIELESHCSDDELTPLPHKKIEQRGQILRLTL